METTVIERPAAQADSLAEYRRLKAESAPAPDPAPQAPPPAEGTSESDGGSVPPESTSQPPSTTPPEKRDKTLEGRIKELRAAGKHDQANKLMVDAATRQQADEIAKLRKELEEVRTPKPAAAPAPVEPAPKPAAVPPPAPAAAADDPEPDPLDAKYAGDDGYTKYLRDTARWDYRQEQRTHQANAEKQRTVSTIQEKLAGAARAIPGIMESIGSVGIGTDAAGLQQFLIEFDRPFEVLHHLATHPDDHQRILALPYTRRMAALERIQEGLESGLPAAGSPPKPPVSKVPPPPPRAGGGSEPAPPPDPSKAKNFDEWKRARRAGRN